MVSKGVFNTRGKGLIMACFKILTYNQHLPGTEVVFAKKSSTADRLGTIQKRKRVGRGEGSHERYPGIPRDTRLINPVLFNSGGIHFSNQVPNWWLASKLIRAFRLSRP